MFETEVETGKGNSKLYKSVSQFLEKDSINYVRYASFYSGKVRRLSIEYPKIHIELMDGSFVMKTQKNDFNRASLNMKLEQTS